MNYLLGDSSKAHENLGWAPKIRFDELVTLMVQAALKESQKGHLVRTIGFSVHNHNE